MLGMPAVVFGGIGTAIYVKFRKYGAIAPAAQPLGEFGPAAEAHEPELATQA